MMKSAQHLRQAIADLKRQSDALSTIQEQYDKLAWDISSPAFAKLRHIHIHLSTATGRMAEICEGLDHKEYGGTLKLLPSSDGVVSAIVADLMHHAAQIADLYALNIHDCVVGRYSQNLARLAPDSELATVIDEFLEK